MPLYRDDPQPAGVILTKTDYLDRVKKLELHDMDGHGYPGVRHGLHLKIDRTIELVPSRTYEIPPDATHICWYPAN